MTLPIEVTLFFGFLNAVLIALVLVFARKSSSQRLLQHQVQPLDRIRAVREILDLLPDASAIIDTEDRVIAASANCVAMGLVDGNRVIPIEIRALNREVQRARRTLSREATVRKTSEAASEWEARLQLSPLDESLSLLIAQDLSEERRFNEARRDFVANVSHELKTPVGALALLAEAVQSPDADPEQVRHFAGRMQKEANRLTDMIADLVELSRVQGAAVVRNPSRIAVSNVIASAVDDTNFLAEGQRINVEVADVSTVGELFGDERQLVSALRNLISNAIKYSPAGAKVGIGARRVDNTIEISVTDQGPGIPEDEIVHIFERFYRVDPSRNRDTGGTGLGLAIVKHICANHGGECTVWSQLGQGSTFTLRLPAYQAPIAATTEVVSA